MPATPTPPALPAVVVADADAYFLTTLRAEAWDLLSSAEKTAALAESILWLKTLHWDTEADCVGRSLDSAYTAAASELALALFRDQTALVPILSNTNREVTLERIETLETRYKSNDPSAPGARGNLLAQRFPWLRQMIGCWASFGSHEPVRLYRN